MLPSLGNGGVLQWTGDLQHLSELNHYLGGPNLCSRRHHPKGVVAAGTQIDLEVTFDASDWTAGLFSQLQ